MPYAFIIAVAVIQGALLLAHFFVYKTTAHFLLQGHPGWTAFARVALVLLSVSFLASMLASFKFAGPAVRALYFGAVTWLGLFYFLIGASALSWIAYALLRTTGMAGAIGTITGTLFLLALGGAAYAFVHAERITAVTVPVFLADMPAEWKGKTAVWISDVHLGHVRGAAFAEKVARAVNAQKPDIVFVGGDLFDGVRFDSRAASAPLKSIEAPLGTFFITGNHEGFGDEQAYLSAVESAGMRILADEAVEVAGMRIVGVGWGSYRAEGDFARTLSKLVATGTPTILLKHEPSEPDVAAAAGVSLMIAGHTHKQQMWPLSYIGKRVYGDYNYGLKRAGAMIAFTSSGVGTWGPPFRLGTNSEIVVFKFQ